jgi:hypothetical protein
MLIFNTIELDPEYLTKSGNDNKDANNNNINNSDVGFRFINKLNNYLLSHFSTPILEQLPLEAWKSEVRFE